MTVHELSINDEEYTVDTDPYRPLREVLREEIGLTGTKKSCETGNCGVCTVQLDGDPIKSCLVPVGKVEDTEITTVEGLGSDDSLSGLQESFVDCFASQCGYCIPGFVVAADALLEDNPDPTADEVREGISGNICRCTGYVKIVEAIEEAAKRGQEQ
jgi:carbon-monoxide dehydrogenase small subunit